MDADSNTIKQGDVFWIQAGKLRPCVPGATHPHVVVQADVLNRSRIPTVVVCALTSNVQQSDQPGNVLLDAGEAGLPRRSVVVVSQVSTVEKTQLGEHIGTLTATRVQQILAGMRFQQRSFFERR